MADRITKSHIKTTFAHYCKALGVPEAKAWNDVGGWFYDYNPTYGGYQIQRVHNASGGVDNPVKEARMPAGEFYRAMWFTIRSIEAHHRF